MTNLLLSLAAATMVGTALFLALLALKPLTGKFFNAKWHYYMSFLPVIFLLGGVSLASTAVGFARDALPVRSSMYEVPTVPGIPVVFDVSGIPVTEITGMIGGHYAPRHWAVPFAEFSEYLPGAINGSLRLPEISPEAIGIIVLIWAVGAILFIVVNLLSYRTFCKMLSDSPLVSSSPIPVIINPNVKTPMLVGFFKPRIVLPDMDVSSDKLQMILEHELVHYRRGDTWLKLAVLIANAVHWFNPAVRFMVRHINSMCELSCDEAVVMQMDAKERKAYGEMILEVLHHGVLNKNLFFSSALCSENIKRRLMNMLNTRKSKRFMLIPAMLVAVLVIGASAIAAYGLMGVMPADYENAEYIAYSADVAPDAPCLAPSLLREIEFEAVLDVDAPFFNLPGENFMPMEEAALLGLNAVEQIMGVNLDGTTVFMDYRARAVSVNSFTDEQLERHSIFVGWSNELGITPEKLADLARDAYFSRFENARLDFDVETIAQFKEDAQHIGIDVYNLHIYSGVTMTLRSQASNSSPSTWIGRLAVTNANGVQVWINFSVDAETGVVRRFAQFLPHQTLETQFGIPMPDRNEQYNLYYSNFAMDFAEALNVFGSEVAMARVHRVDGINVPPTTLMAHVRCVDGSTILLEMFRDYSGGTRTMEIMSVSLISTYVSSDFDWVTR